MPIDLFDGPQNLQNERLLYQQASETLVQQIIELLPKNSSMIDRIVQSSGQTMEIMLDLLFLGKSQLVCFEHAPAQQADSFAKMLFQSALLGADFPIVSPVCPDYGESGYSLRNGMSATAKRSIDAFRTYQPLFTRHGVHPHLTIHLADTEAHDPLVLQATGETTTSFIQKLMGTRESIDQYVHEQKLDGAVTASSMEQYCRTRGIAYDAAIESEAETIEHTDHKRIRSVFERLKKDRKQNGDYHTIFGITPGKMVANELAGYSLYGKAVGGRAFIVSPDAKSAVPAYNFSTSTDSVNATAYIKRQEGKRL